MGPVHNVAQGTAEMNGLQHSRGHPAGGGADESPLIGQSQQCFGLQIRIIAVQKLLIAGVEVILPGHQYGLHDPLRRPGRSEKEILQGSAGHTVFPVDTVMGQLVDEGVGFIGYPLPVPVDIHPSKGGRPDTVLAKIPDPVQERIRRVKPGGSLLKGIGNRFPDHLQRMQGFMVVLKFTGAEGNDLPGIFRHQDGLRPCIAPVGRDYHGIGMPPFSQGQGKRRIAHRSSGLPLEAPPVHRFPHMETDRIPTLRGKQGQTRPPEGGFSEINKMKAFPTRGNLFRETVGFLQGIARSVILPEL